MIEIQKIFAIRCDRCGVQHVDFDSGQDAFLEAEDARESAVRDGWVEIGRRHYCPNCYDAENNIDQPDIDK